MKFTDTFFEFPARVYDTFSMIQAMKEEEETNEVRVPLWILGFKRVPMKDVFDMQWKDFYSEPDINDAIALERRGKGKGLDSTLVTIKDEDYFCPLPRAKFEELVNTFYDSLENEIPQGLTYTQHTSL